MTSGSWTRRSKCRPMQSKRGPLLRERKHQKVVNGFPVSINTSLIIPILAKRRKVDNSDSNDSDTNYADTRVFDSDEDSDVEISDVLTPSKKKVLEFMETATASELQLMHSCSKKKVDALLASRPFTGWIDLVRNFQFVVLVFISHLFSIDNFRLKSYKATNT